MTGVAPDKTAILSLDTPAAGDAFGSGDVSLPRARTNDVGVLFATISRDSPTVLSQQPRGLTLAIEYLRGDSTRDRSQMRVCCVPHETIGVCMTLSVCGLGVRNAPSPVVCHAHCPAGAVSVQGKNQTNPYSYITVERRSERTGAGYRRNATDSRASEGSVHSR